MTVTISGVPTSCSTVVDILRWRGQEQPERTAYTFHPDGETQAIPLSYGELDRSARVIAAQLQSLASPGERAVLALPAGLAYRTAFFGCLYAGLVAVPFQVARSDQGPAPLVAAVAASQATVALTTSAAHEAMAPLLAEASVLRDLQWVVVDELPDDLEDGWTEPVTRGDSLAWLPLTSGSTGLPKGVMHTHASILRGLPSVVRSAGFTSESRIVSWLPPHFAFAT